MNIPFLNLSPMHTAIKKEMLKTFERVYDSNWFILGDELSRFEKNYANFNDTSYALGTSNGLDALFLSLKALDIGEGDEVIVPSNTFIASVLSISYTGATPIFVEPSRVTYNMTPSNIKSAVSEHTKVIMPVHLYGQACQMDAITEIAGQYDLKVVEDNAQAHGSSFKSIKTGSWGHINATSFYPGKNLGALGDAGAITTDDKVLLERANILRNYGSSEKYIHEEIGYNKRLDELQAAFLNVKLDFLQQWTKQRQQIAKWYSNTLEGIGDLALPEVHPDATHVYHLYVIRTAYRDELQKFLKEKGIDTLIHYPIPPHLQQAYSNLGYKKGDFPIAEELAETCLSLPLWPGMEKDQALYVVEIIKSFYESLA